MDLRHPPRRRARSVPRQPAGHRGADRFGDLAIGGTTPGDLIALGIRTGRIAWKLALATRPWARQHSRSPALARDRVFWAGPDGKVYALKAVSGKVLWERDLGFNVTTAVLVAEGHVYVGSADVASSG